jgi:lysophospholipase L1-like esterase
MNIFACIITILYNNKNKNIDISRISLKITWNYFHKTIFRNLKYNLIIFLFSVLLFYQYNADAQILSCTNQEINISRHPYHSKINIVILGDSNTAIGGDDCNCSQGWNKWFKDKFAPATCKSYARSGASWTNTLMTAYNITENTDKLSNDNVIYNQINRLKEKCKIGEQISPNLILIAAGTNDAWFITRRPHLFSKTVAQAFSNSKQLITNIPVNKMLSLAESIRYNCEILFKLFPEAMIILLTPMQSTAIPLSRIRRVGNIIEACARHMNLNVIRQDYNSSVIQGHERRRKTFTYDGTHTNLIGAKINGYYLANRIIKIVSNKK